MSEKNRRDMASLVRLCRSGDRAAWRGLTSRVAPVIFSICRSMKLSREESFDIFGQVMYLMLTNLNRLRSPEKLLSYVGTTTRREIYSMNRRGKLIDYLADNESTLRTPDDSPGPEERLEESARQEAVLNAMAKLPERDYRLLRLLFFDQQRPDYKEVSEVLGIPEASIGPTRARSLHKLRRILKRSGFEF